MRVMLEMKFSPSVHAASLGLEPMFLAEEPVVTATAGAFRPDSLFPPVQLPPRDQTRPGAMMLTFDEPASSTYIIRGDIPDKPEARDHAVRALQNRVDVVGVFSDPYVDAFPVCPGDPPVGGEVDVARLLDRAGLQRAGMDGAGVPIAVVDTGFNYAYLQALGRSAPLDSAQSWSPPNTATAPGQWPVNHGTMCAFDATILAPVATLLDYAVLQTVASGGSPVAGLLTDAVLAYRNLLSILLPVQPAKRRLVVNNSWGIYDPAWDFPSVHPGNYTHSPGHPFNLITGALDAAGADILFVAGNCGPQCPLAAAGSARGSRQSVEPTPTPRRCPSAEWTRPVPLRVTRRRGREL